MNEWSAEAWETAVRGVFRRALGDAQFRKLALTDSRAAFEQVTGKPAPEGVKFRFVEELEEHVLVLPKTQQSQGELSEIDLSRILHHAFRQQSIPPKIRS